MHAGALSHFGCSLGHFSGTAIIHVIANSCAFSTLSKTVCCDKALPAVFSSTFLPSFVEGYSLLFSLE